MTSRRNLLLIGILFFMIFAVRTFIGITTNSLSFIELLMWGALTYLCFAASYIYPQFKAKDERSRLIKQKGMQYSLFAVLIFLILIIFGVQFNIIALTTIEIARILVSLTIITIFSSWIILSKKY
ncbi:hypothetical protein ACP2W8_22090 [Bacillus subtilis]|uniref:hypothetical protein n=1 Tax=Bacillus subtilis TaxID=1423 RepID=UPI003CF02CB7